MEQDASCGSQGDHDGQPRTGNSIGSLGRLMRGKSDIKPKYFAAESIVLTSPPGQLRLLILRNRPEPDGFVCSNSG